MTPEAAPILKLERPTAEPAAVSGVPRLRRVHRLLGFLVLLVFLGTGVYLRVRFPEAVALAMDMGQRATFRSRHIYILSSAIAHLLLGSYLVPAATRRRRFFQALGSGLMGVSSALLIAAFFIDPYRAEMRSEWSSQGVILLLAGALLHVAAGRKISSGKAS